MTTNSDSWRSPLLIAGRAARGFSILEVLVVIGVIVVLLALALPPLARSLMTGRQVSSASNVRTLQAILVMYTADNRDEYPVMLEGEMYRISPVEEINYGWWSMFDTWPAVVYSYLPIDQNRDVYVSPGAARQRESEGWYAWPTSYHYSTSFVGAPALWSESATADASFKDAQRVGGVLQPSQKALLWDSEFGSRTGELPRIGPDLAASIPMAMADGSVAERRPSDATDAVINPFHNSVGDLRLHNTPNGVHGLDYR